MSRLIDISLTISNALPVWPGDPSITLERVSDIDAGAAINMSRLDAGVHTGTHVDAPLHFIPHDLSVDELELDRFIGECQVIMLDGAGPITADELAAASIATTTERLLIKTSNSQWWQSNPETFNKDFRALHSSAARWIVERGIRLVGVDYLSVEAFEAEEHHPTHNILLGARVGVIEGLNLAQVEPGRYRLMCLPLKLKGSDGAPARAVLETLD